jgi:hypothetical protein
MHRRSGRLGQAEDTGPEYADIVARLCSKHDNIGAMQGGETKKA